MCLHTHAQVRQALRSHQGSQWAVLWLTGPLDEKTGEVQVYGVDCVEFVQPRNVANRIRDIREWHTEAKGWTIHLDDINVKRYIHGLPQLKEEALPEPTGKAPRSPDRATASA